MRKTMTTAVFLLAFVCALPGRLLAQAPGASAPSLEDQLKTKRVDVQFEGTPLVDVLVFLSQLSGCNIVLDPNLKHPEDRDMLILLRVEDASLGALLDIIVGRSLCYEIKGNVIVITDRDPAAPLPTRPPTERENRVREDLKAKTATVSFADTPLTEVVNVLSSLARTNVVLDPHMEDDAIRQRPVALDLNNASLNTIRDLLVGKDLQWQVKDNVVLISERVPKAHPKPVTPQEKEAHVRRILDARRTSVQWEGERLSEAVDYLSSAARIPIVFDPAILEWDEFKERPITVTLHNASVATILDVILGKELIYVVKGEAVVITTKERGEK